MTGLLVLCTSSYGQQNREMYFDLDFGVGVANERLPEQVTYVPLQLTPKFSISIARKDKPPRFLFYTEPQVLLVILSPEGSVEFEGGINVGFAYQHLFSKYRVYAGIGSGPHFITVETELQAKGFIFSDNFFAGVSRLLKKEIMLNLQLRFRHISNAGLKSPNLGIDNFFLMLGFSKAFRGSHQGGQVMGPIK